MTIKKSFLPLVQFLEENKDKKVSSILEEIYKLTSSKGVAKASYSDENGNIIAIFCYYHKQWELLDEVEYGKKSHSTTGYNTMCKIGVRHWTRQNKAKKEVGSRVLAMLENGEIQADEIQETKERLMAEASEIVTEDMPRGFETIEELEEYLNSK